MKILRFLQDYTVIKINLIWILLFIIKINSVDLNGDNRLSFDEFKKLWVNCENKSNKNRSTVNGHAKRLYSDSQLKSLFDEFDRDRSGYLDPNELKQLLINSGEYPNEERINQLIKSVDINKDGKINFHEFLQLYKDYRKPSSNIYIC